MALTEPTGSRLSHTSGKRRFSTPLLAAGGVLLATGVLAAIAAPDARATTGSTGQQLYVQECGVCHFEGGTGTFMVGRRLGEAKALLEGRTDLRPAYVEFVVRNGLNSMPPLSRVEVTDEELAQIARYLAEEGR